ncbi:MAG: OmpW family outer membrane protein [Capsulimonadales bacterium]|nr:OmpW family outer membrane protein [Capsulimonadales bacterium]
MRSLIFGSLAIVGAILPTVPAHAQDTPTTPPVGPWLVRLRALNLSPANKSNAFSALGINFGSDAVEVNSKWFPEIDVTYFFTPNFAAELILTYPQEHTVRLNGARLGTFKHLPPTLTAQYHFNIPKSPVKPYAGLGINYTRISDVKLSVAGTELDLSKSSFGFAFNLGVDYKFTEKIYINLDYKYVDLNADVKVKNGGKLTKAQIDPDLISFGVGYRF